MNLSPWLRSPITRLIGGLLSFAILFLIFSAPPMDLKDYRGVQPDMADTLQSRTKTDSLQDSVKTDTLYYPFLMAEHAKVVDEIKMRIDQENEWFRYKFLFVGALFLALLTHLSSQARRTKHPPDIETFFTQLLQSNVILSLLALAFVVSIVIDIHMRMGVTVINQAGLWIRYHVEPVLLGIPVDTTMWEGRILGWEHYLRVPSGMQASPVWSLLYWSHLDFLTVFMYMAYLLGFQSICLRGGGRKRWLTVSAFAVVHISMACFAVMAHSAPENYTYRMPCAGEVSSLSAMGFFFVIALLLVTVPAPYLLLIWRTHADAERDSLEQQ